MRVAILGGGISGLAAACFLKGKYDITLLEKSTIPGGVVGSAGSKEFFFEKGPRTVRLKKSSSLWNWIVDLGLEKEILFAEKSAKKRLLWTGEKFKTIPGFHFSLLKELLLEVRRPSLFADETIDSFARRRFGSYIAEMIFDPLTKGIYGGDSRELSIRACFPLLKKWEEEQGSILMGFLKREKEAGVPLFSLKGGLGNLIEKAAMTVGSDLFLEEEVKQVRWESSTAIIETCKRSLKADHVISALPLREAASLFGFDEKLFPGEDLTVVNLGYHKKISLPQAFGYLVSSQEKTPLLGVVFDSSTFPQQNRFLEETRVTAMVSGRSLCNREIQNLIDHSFARHLKVRETPSYVAIHRYQEAFPKMPLGFVEKREALLETVKQRYPHLHLIGNYVSGVSLGDCVSLAKRVANSIDSLSVKE